MGCASAKSLPPPTHVEISTFLQKHLISDLVPIVLQYARFHGWCIGDYHIYAEWTSVLGVTSTNEVYLSTGDAIYRLNLVSVPPSPDRRDEMEYKLTKWIECEAQIMELRQYQDRMYITTDCDLKICNLPTGKLVSTIRTPGIECNARCWYRHMDLGPEMIILANLRQILIFSFQGQLQRHVKVGYEIRAICMATSPNLSPALLVACPLGIHVYNVFTLREVGHLLNLREIRSLSTDGTYMYIGTSEIIYVHIFADLFNADLQPVRQFPAPKDFLGLKVQQGRMYILSKSRLQTWI